MTPEPLPEPVLRLIWHPDSSKALITVGEDGYPHAIVVGAIVVDEADNLYVGEAFMHRTSKNLEERPKVEFIVWMGKDGYTVKALAKGRVSDGPALERLNQLLAKKGMSASAAWAFEPVEVWDSSASYSAGDRIV